MRHHYEDIVPALFTLISIPFFAEYLTSRFISWFGLFVSCAGLVLWWLGISARSAIKSTRSLHTKGIYKYIRHPIYTGSALTMVGWVILTASWWLLFVVLVAVVGLIFKVVSDEEHLKEKYGEKFDEYRKSTWF